MSAFRGNFAFGKQQTLALYQHYYELVAFSTPIDFMEDSLIQTMKNTGKPMFRVPAKYSKINQDLIFVFEVEEEFDIYYYKYVVANKKIIKEYDPSIIYKEW